ncbi:MAG: cytochrome c biogenesis protein CcsA [Muribaculaceae bacterium]|nr:cytochrome c biogenesis protein CcsA [Muribaculaceae bacterium]
MLRSDRISLFIVVSMVLAIGATSFMPVSIYSSGWWTAFGCLTLIVLIYAIVVKRLYSRITVFMIHISLVCMIAGGIVTALTSYRGMLHLVPGVPADTFTDMDGRSRQLPATVTLLSFRQQMYPGMRMPNDFISEVMVDGDERSDTLRISINKIGRIGAYRLYQTSYDDKGGSILTVSHDPWGIGFVYLGFLLFAISGLILICRKLITARGSRKLGKLTGILLVSIIFGTNNGEASRAVPQCVADSLAREQVLFGGKAVPFATAATLLTNKLTGTDRVGGLSAETFVASLLYFPEDWASERVIKVPKSLRIPLGVKGQYVSVKDLYCQGRYRPQLLYQGGEGRLDRDILQLDERVMLLADLWNGELIQPVMDPQLDMRPSLSVEAEILFYHLKPVRLLFIFCIIVAFTAFLSIFVHIERLVKVCVVVTLLGGVVIFCWRWWLEGMMPLVAMYDIMAFIGYVIMLITTVIALREYSGLLIGILMLCSGFMLIVAWIGMKDPVITPVLPVLATPWLSIHVSLVMISYTLLGLTMPFSLIGLFVRSLRTKMMSLSDMLLLPGVYLLGMGIIAGAMWANVSWGRYWAWDPKETWALVTMLLYAIPLHKSFKMQNSPRLLLIYLIFAFLSILMTYIGVNHLPSLHTYQ